MRDKVDKKRRKATKIFGLIGIFLIILVGGSFVALNWYNNAIYTPVGGSQEIEFIVEEGDSLVSIAEELENTNIIRSADALRIFLRLNNLSPNIKVGTYTLRQDLTIPEIINIFEQGVFKASVAITVREGLWDEDIAEIFNSALSDAGSEKRFSTLEFLEIVKSPDSVEFSSEVEEFLSRAKPSGKPLTGYLFPDTYRVNNDADAKEVIEVMVLNLNRRLNDNLIDPTNIFLNQDQLRSFYESLVLASILEREAGREDPIETVSGVFHNRLRDNFPLQSDATVNFATGKNVRGASFEDLEVDSPYNTYKYSGLPPTPINNPGIRSIKASITPEDTDFFFFWHASQTNKIYFGRTFEEHQANIRNYP